MNDFIAEILKNPLWQWLWILAMLISILWYAQKDDKKTIKIFMVSNFVWIAHFYFMWILSAMVSCIIAIARSFLSLKYKRNRRIFLWIIAAILVAWIITYEWKLSLLPIIASCISAYWFFFLERIRLRMFLFISSICWLTFSIWSFSIWWIISDSLVLIISIIVMYKMIKYEWEKVYFVDKIMSILKKPEPDVWRFTFLVDYFKMKKTSLKDKIKYYYKKADSIKIYFFKDKKFLKIEKEEFSI